VENRKKLKSKKMDMLRSIAKQFGESVLSALKKKRKAIVGRNEGYAKREGFKPGMKEWCDGILIIISINVSSITTV